MYNTLYQEGNSIVDILIDENYEIPELPIESSPEEIKDHSKLYGASVLMTSVKSIVSSIYAKLCDEYQQRINSEYPGNKWMLIKTITDVKKFIGFIKKIKFEERGAPRSSLLDVRKSITSSLLLDTCCNAGVTNMKIVLTKLTRMKPRASNTLGGSYQPPYAADSTCFGRISYDPDLPFTALSYHQQSIICYVHPRGKKFAAGFMLPNDVVIEIEFRFIEGMLLGDGAPLCDCYEVMLCLLQIHR